MADADKPGRTNRLRIAAWGGAAGAILLPLAAMQVTDEVNWGLEDFVFAITLIGGVGLVFEVAVRMTANLAYRCGAGIALAGIFLMLWVNAAVGIIGNEGNPANLMFFGVLAVALAGAFVAQFRADGMARAMIATTVAQIAVFIVALAAGFGFTGPITVFFSAFWLASAWLFRKAAREMPADAR